MFVTTVYNPSAELEIRSRQLAVAMNSQWVSRSNRSLNKIRNLYGDEPILVLTGKELKYYHHGEMALFFHPGTAVIRIKRLISGVSDPLVHASGMLPGDTVLDCTAGMASDSIVFSYVSGAEGRVVALESEPILYLLVHQGLACYTSEISSINDAMRRIKLIKMPHLAYLKNLKDASFDIIYFDPMFRRPIEESSAIAPVREIANHSPLCLEAVTEARRVARKKVIMKEHRDSDQFIKLGFAKQFRANSQVAYGVIE